MNGAQYGAYFWVEMHLSIHVGRSVQIPGSPILWLPAPTAPAEPKWLPLNPKGAGTPLKVSLG